MKLSEISKSMGLENLTPALGAGSDVDVAGAHASDLLSDVLANSPAGGLLVTLQVHMNVVAVALHAGLSGVIFTSGMKPDDAVMSKAVEEKLRLYASQEPSFDVAGKLYALGLRGGRPERGRK